ncbi:MAG: asparaginase [Polaromonas sp.]|nr:asparaginase [Polaromonas sp.]
MQVRVDVNLKKIVLLGTGGTIAGTAASPSEHTAYRAGQLGVDALLASVPGLADRFAVEAEQVAQIDSKDMDAEVWIRLALRVEALIADPDVHAVVVTHGTDTLEETAFFLHASLHSTKAVVLTCAMRPATALAPDGPQNMLDAFTLAAEPGATGVMVVCAGVIHRATHVQKVHPYRLDAFSSGDAGPLGYVEQGRVRLTGKWPAAQYPRAQHATKPIAELPQAPDWPRVEIVTSHAGAGAALVDGLVAQGVNGLVVAATGNGTVHHRLEAALLQAMAQGVRVLRATRCTEGEILPAAGDAIPAAQGLSPVKARIALLLALISGAAP